MNEHSGILDVGAQDPTLKNSPIADEFDEEFEFMKLEVPGGAVCYFNGQVFDHGAIVRSGTAMLKCDRGLWWAVGPGDPENP